MTSKVIYGRAWPRCDSPLTVGPHTYIPTCPGVIDLKTSFCLEYELCTFNSLMFTFEAKQSPLFFCYQLLYYYHLLLCHSLVRSVILFSLVSTPVGNFLIIEILHPPAGDNEHYFYSSTLFMH